MHKEPSKFKVTWRKRQNLRRLSQTNAVRKRWYFIRDGTSTASQKPWSVEKTTWYINQNSSAGPQKNGEVCRGECERDDTQKHHGGDCGGRGLLQGVQENLFLLDCVYSCNYLQLNQLKAVPRLISKWALSTTVIMNDDQKLGIQPYYNSEHICLHGNICHVWIYPIQDMCSRLCFRGYECAQKGRGISRLTICCETGWWSFPVRMSRYNCSLLFSYVNASAMVRFLLINPILSMTSSLQSSRAAAISTVGRFSAVCLFPVITSKSSMDSANMNRESIFL